MFYSCSALWEFTLVLNTRKLVDINVLTKECKHLEWHNKKYMCCVCLSINPNVRCRCCIFMCPILDLNLALFYIMYCESLLNMCRGLFEHISVEIRCPFAQSHVGRPSLRLTVLSRVVVIPHCHGKDQSRCWKASALTTVTPGRVVVVVQGYPGWRRHSTRVVRHRDATTRVDYTTSAIIAFSMLQNNAICWFSPWNNIFKKNISDNTK